MEEHPDEVLSGNPNSVKCLLIELSPSTSGQSSGSSAALERPMTITDSSAATNTKTATADKKPMKCE